MSTTPRLAVAPTHTRESRINKLTSGRDEDGIRRDYCGSSLRRFAHGDAPVAEGISCALGRPRTFPSDTVSSHVVHPLGAAALMRWGLHERLAATDCPSIHTYAFDFGPFTLSGSHDRRARGVLRQADRARQTAR
jgi:hypothetical protein